jgi:hypothetical protein
MHSFGGIRTPKKMRYGIAYASVVDPDPDRVVFVSFCRIRIQIGIGIEGVPIRIGIKLSITSTCIFYFLNESFNMLSKIP